MKSHLQATVRQIARRFLVMVLVLATTLSSMNGIAHARFISPDDWDPTLPGVGTNRYAYAHNDPINKSDPNGHQSGDVNDSDGDGDEDIVDRYPGVPDKEIIDINPVSAAFNVLGQNGGGLSYSTVNSFNRQTRSGAYQKGIAAGQNLNEFQSKSFKKYVEKIPSNSLDNINIARGENGSVSFSTISPGKSPGSYAIYTKTVDADGKTIEYFKDVYDKNGNLLSRKDKMKVSGSVVGKDNKSRKADKSNDKEHSNDRDNVDIKRN